MGFLLFVYVFAEGRTPVKLDSSIIELYKGYMQLPPSRFI